MKRMHATGRELGVHKSHSGLARRIALALTALLGLAVLGAQAQTVRIQPRVLTPQEKKSYTNTTQLASGLRNVGIGQPLYLEALVTKSANVTNVTWTLLSKPTGSAATLQNSPLTNGTYDVGDRNAYDVASRQMLIPDVVCTSVNGDYVVTVTVDLTNKTITATNTFYGSQYLGINHRLCVLCHADKMATFTNTYHSTAFTRKINGEAGVGFKATCASCHVLGYDANPAATNGGFDDVMTQTGWTWPTNLGNLAAAASNWTNMPKALQDKSNIQCENCHGPADRHVKGYGETNAIGVTLSSGNCGQCHDSMTHHTKNFEWSQMGHSFGQAFNVRAECQPCHSGRGFVKAFDPDYSTTTLIPEATGNEGITCAVCHDPHAHQNPHQIRTLANVVLGDPLMPAAIATSGGDGKLCMNCHRVRNRTAEPYVTGTWTTNRAGIGTRFGVHDASQADMLIGTNAIEYGMQMPRSRHFAVVTNTCVQCHMQETPASGAASHKVGGHTFRLSYDGGTTNTTADDVHLTEACAECHGHVHSFNFGGEDYDRDGMVEGVQSEIQGLLTTLSLLLPPVGSTTITPATNYTLSQAKGLYNYRFVEMDASLGVHNPKYAAAVLQASIDDLAGGIDVDRDGLIDSWEKATFGDLTSQTGKSDADGDGISNEREMAAGTNPRVKDSDADGIDDNVELEAFTNPLDAASVPGTNAVVILPAVEVGYVANSMGVTQSFQMIDSLTGSGSWSNISTKFVTSSNAWFYQLMSTRDIQGKFFRVKSE